MIPNPPIKRLKPSTSSEWFCTEENTDLTQVGTDVFTWNGEGYCFGVPSDDTYTMTDGSTVKISGGKVA